jgi:hypothetical protein
MYLLVLLALSLHISIVDLRTHKITNRSNLLLAVLLLLRPNFSKISVVILAFLVAFVITVLLKIGMGDLKLWSVLLFSNGEILLTLRYLNLMAVALTLLLALTVIRHRTLSGSVPLAPVILAPFLLLYLAI